MKFRYYIVDLNDSVVYGANDANVAIACADRSDDFLVIDVQHSELVTPAKADGTDAVAEPIPHFPTP